MPGTGLDVDRTDLIQIGHGDKVEVIVQVRNCTTGAWQTTHSSYRGAALPPAAQLGNLATLINIMPDEPLEPPIPFKGEEIAGNCYPRLVDSASEFVAAKLGHTLVRTLVQPVHD